MKLGLTKISSLWLALALAALTPAAPAQDTNTNAPAVTPASNQVAVEIGKALGVRVKVRQSKNQQEAVRVGSDYTLKAGETASDVVVVMGNATIDGTVEGDLVNVLGNLTLGSNAVVKGNTVVVAGSATVASNAVVKENLVVVLGALESEPGFEPKGERVVIGFANIPEKLRWAIDWFKHGPLWGRPLTHDIPFVWLIAGILFALHFLLNLLFDKPIAATTKTLSEKPLTAFLVGLLVLMLAAPVLLILMATGVGILLVPFLLLAFLIAIGIGKLAVTRWIGGSIGLHGTGEQRYAPVGSFLVGAAVIHLLYLVPLLGFASWAMIRVIGLGAATMTFLRAIRRENPTPPVAPVPLTVPPPAGAPPDPGAPVGLPAVTGAPPLDLVTQPRASFLARFAAFALDFLLVMLTAGFLGLMHSGGPGLAIFLLIAYKVAFLTWRGTTIGGIICNLRVVRSDGQPLRFADALVRSLSTIFSFLAMLLGVLWILWDRERQAWHDKIAGTYVVKMPRSSPLL